MPSSYDSRLRLELQATGENASTWGARANTNFELIAEAIAGHVSINVGGGAPYTLSTAEASTDEARNMMITFNGVLTSSIPVYVPQLSKSWFFRDNTSGNFGITVRTSIGTGVCLSRTNINNVVCDGVSVYPASEVDRVARSGDTMTGPLYLVAGTSTSSSQALRKDEIQVLISAAIQAALVSKIVIWSGSVASIPSGWALCDGTNGTPDLRNSFVLGAGGSYAVGATGGAISVNTSVGGDHSHGDQTGATSLTAAQIPAHTHAVSVLDPGHAHALSQNPAVFGQAPSQLGSAGNLISSTSLVAVTASTGISIQVSSVGSGETHIHTITSAGTHSHQVSVMPPYYALAFIMKL